MEEGNHAQGLWETMHSRYMLTLLEHLATTPGCSSLVWPGHRISYPQEMPPSGSGRDPNTHPLWWWGGECFLSVGQGDLGTPWGLHPSHLLAGEVPNPVPPPWPRPSFKLCPVRMNQLSQLVKAGPLVFMPSPQETRVTASPAQLSRGPGSSLYKHPQPVQEGMEMV